MITLIIGLIIGVFLGWKYELAINDFIEHWREEFTGNICAQVFLHYNHVNGQFADSNLYDKRPLLGLPPFTKK